MSRALQARPVEVDLPPIPHDALKAALADRTRPRRPSALGASLTLGWRALLKIRHVPEQLFDVLFTPIISTVMFTYLFGGALAGSTTGYLQYLLPGVLVQTVLFASVQTGITLNTDITKGIFDRFRSLPIWRPAPLVGALFGDVARYGLASFVVMSLGYFMGFRPEAGLPGVLAAVALVLFFAFGLGWVFTSVGLLMRSPNSVSAVSMLAMMPLTFASNIFVRPATMPEWMQSLVASNPVTQLVTAARALVAGHATIAELGPAITLPIVLMLVFMPLASYLYRVKS